MVPFFLLKHHVNGYLSQEYTQKCVGRGKTVLDKKLTGIYSVLGLVRANSADQYIPAEKYIEGIMYYTEEEERLHVGWEGTKYMLSTLKGNASGETLPRNVKWGL